MSERDERLLSEFLDDALERGQRSEVERRLGAEPDLAGKLERMQAADEMLRGWFDEATPADDRGAAEAIRAGFRKRRNQRRRGAVIPWLVPVAASVAVAVVGLLSLDREVDRRVASAIDSMRAERAADLDLLAGAVQQALETRQSGEQIQVASERTGFTATILPRRTWKSQSGHWCREFLEIYPGMSPSEAPVSVACRTDEGVWERLKTELKDPTIIVPPPLAKDL